MARLTITQWVLIAFFIMLATLIAGEAIHDLVFTERMMMRNS